MKKAKIDLKKILGDNVVDELREVFHDSTGMIITFSPLSERKKVDFYPENERSRFCSMIQSASSGRKRCLKCENSAVAEAFKTGKPKIYTCHAGLKDIVVPLIYGGVLVGSLLSGQILTSAPGVSDFDDVWKRTANLGLDKSSLRKAYFAVRVFPEKKLDSAVKLLSFFANYILRMESTVHSQKELIAYQEKLLVASGEKRKLQAELKLAMPFLRLETLAEEDMKRGERIIMEAKHFIETHYSEGLRLAGIAEAVFLSPNYFSALFKKYTGLTFREYLVKVRVEKSKELLEDIRLSISEISFKVGFHDPNYFSLSFHKHTGLSPSAYRAKIKPGPGSAANNCFPGKRAIFFSQVEQ